jgi:hypothetical protein
MVKVALVLFWPAQQQLELGLPFLSCSSLFWLYLLSE